MADWRYSGGVVGVIGHEHVREQARAGAATLDRRRRRGRLRHEIGGGNDGAHLSR